MKIRLLEIELGTHDPAASKEFYNTVLGLEIAIDQENLNVFKTGVTGIDFNTSTHLPAKLALTSFLTDDLKTLMQNLDEAGVPYYGPSASHLGMSSITFHDPDGNLIRVNQPGDESPSWLRL